MRTSPRHCGVARHLARYIPSCFAALAFSLVLLPLPSVATSVVPPSFDSLVAQADYIVHTVVKSKNSYGKKH